ncbi:spore germination protein [Paenibacillus daejeonensis]|uniref:spore germination protein n=1 Tax=Paenibacillus daejeonensis TaxID=135193 RepID=UPI000365B4B7|nr:spore germination protein [Paenibacillus daejeonensis]
MFFGKRSKATQQPLSAGTTDASKSDRKTNPFTPSLKTNLDALNQLLGHSSDLSSRSLGSPLAPDITMSILYLGDLVDDTKLNEHVLRPLLSSRLQSDLRSNDLVELIGERVIEIGSTSVSVSLNECADRLLEGYCLLLIQEAACGLLIDIREIKVRQVSEPSAETVVRGAQISFNESISTNLNLLRQILRSPSLHVEEMEVGSETRTQLALIYLDGVASSDTVNTVRSRLQAIQISSVLDSGYIEALIQDKGYTPFPTIKNTERPDAVAGGLLEGQIAIIVDGSPFVLVAPVTFFQQFQSPEDYYIRFDIATFLRLIRYAAFIISMTLPSLYIAVTTFHQEMLPTTLLITLAAQREGIPFPGLVEALMMELTFEILREAGVRMPRAIGPAISIVGALVLGQAAVDAGIVSAGMVIIVSFTAICNFVIPQLNMAIAARLIRFLFMLLAGMFGLMGIIAGVLAVMIHVVRLESFGVPYMSPLAPFSWSRMKDTFIRAPLQKLIKREPHKVFQPDNKQK